MFSQLWIGALVVSFTLATTAAFIGAAIRTLTHFGPWLTKPPHTFKTTVALVGVTLWLLAALSVSVWTWAAVYIGIGVFETLEPALYFSVFPSLPTSLRHRPPLELL